MAREEKEKDWGICWLEKNVGKRIMVWRNDYVFYNGIYGLFFLYIRIEWGWVIIFKNRDDLVLIEVLFYWIIRVIELGLLLVIFELV